MDIRESLISYWDIVKVLAIDLALLYLSVMGLMFAVYFIIVWNL